jgi:hypothetical protein
MKLRLSRLAIGATTALLAASLAVAAPAAASSVHTARGLSGATTVTTAPGIATTLIGKGVLPLPILPNTGFRLGYHDGLTATYRFPITSGNPSLSGPSGDILHSGGIYFTSLRAHLAISNFDIDLAAGKVFATKLNGAPARVAVLDLNLSTLKVTTSNGATVLSGITVTLDSEAASALDATFANLNLPAGLAFGSATVTLRP